MKKLDLKKIVEAMKPAKDIKKEVKAPDKLEPKGPRVRDMRQEAIDGGSHGAAEYFKDTQE